MSFLEDFINKYANLRQIPANDIAEQIHFGAGLLRIARTLTECHSARPNGNQLIIQFLRDYKVGWVYDEDYDYIYAPTELHWKFYGEISQLYHWSYLKQTLQDNPYCEINNAGLCLDHNTQYGEYVKPSPDYDPVNELWLDVMQGIARQHSLEIVCYDGELWIYIPKEISNDD